MLLKKPKLFDCLLLWQLRYTLVMEVTKNGMSGRREIQSVRCLQQVLRLAKDQREKIPLSSKNSLGSVSLKLYIQH